MNGVDAPPPTATIGSISASATAGGGGGGGGSNAASRRWGVDWTPLVVVAIVAGAAWM